ncbi:MAG TPA: hypothetical protein VMT45_02035 [Thermoanaerobaculaceae bacterium]|nr:hypothetical protein [Thermoanaerobaculaceae bacterium]
MSKSIRTGATLAGGILVACAAMAAAQAPVAPPAPPAVPMQWVGNMINMEGGGRTFLTVHADSFSSPEVVQALLEMLRDKGQDAVVAQLNAMPPIGYMKTTNTVAYYFPVIRYIPTATGYRIVAVCARQITAMGMATKPIVTTEYPVGAIILNVNKNGKNEGQALPAIKVEFDKEGKFDPKSYGTEPLRILNIKEEKVK